MNWNVDLENTVTVAMGQMVYDCPVNMDALITKSSMLHSYSQSIQHINQTNSLNLTLQDFTLVPKPEAFEKNLKTTWRDLDRDHQGVLTMVIHEEVEFPVIQSTIIERQESSEDQEIKESTLSKGQKKRANERRKKQGIVSQEQINVNVSDIIASIQKLNIAADKQAVSISDLNATIIDLKSTIKDLTSTISDLTASKKEQAAAIVDLRDNITDLRVDVSDLNSIQRR